MHLILRCISCCVLDTVDKCIFINDLEAARAIFPIIFIAGLERIGHGLGLLLRKLLLHGFYEFLFLLLRQLTTERIELQQFRADRLRIPDKRKAPVPILVSSRIAILEFLGDSRILDVIRRTNQHCHIDVSGIKAGSSLSLRRRGLQCVKKFEAK